MVRSMRLSHWQAQSQCVKRALNFFLTAFVFGISFQANAQMSALEPEPNAKTQVLSRPAGAIVALRGEYDLAGSAPYTVVHYLKGYYKIKATKHGYENWSKDFLFTGRGNEKISIKLSPKTRPKGFYRSMLFPGWGQAYADQRVKGGIIATAQCVSVGVLIYQNAKYNDALDDFNAAAAAYRRGQSDAVQRPLLLNALNAAQSELDDRYEARRRWALVAASIYVYNLLDILVFFPSYHHNNVDVRVTIAPSADPAFESPQVGVQAQF